MRRISSLTIAFAIGISASLTAACDKEDDVRIEARMCERFDECNFLQPGVAVDDCIDDRIMCTDDLVSSEYADWKSELEDCLSRSNCDNYLSCWENVSHC